MTSLIDNLDSILDNLKSEVELLLSTYTVSIFLRFPAEGDKFPQAIIVPIKITPIYVGGLEQEVESGLAEIELHLIVKIPYDYRGSTLLTDLDTVLEKLRTLRFDETKWKELRYTGGVEFAYTPITKAILQSAIIKLSIESDS